MLKDAMSIRHREAVVISMRYCLGMNTDYLPDEIRRLLDVARERARQIEVGVLHKPKHLSSAIKFGTYISLTY
jgi:RNA polymerase primary sigma factor